MSYAVRPLEQSIDIAADPERVWQVISDVRRTGEWSPECRKVFVVGGGPAQPGKLLVGINRRGPVVWPTRSTVTVYEPGAAIGWSVRDSGAVWTYRIEPTLAGSRLVETREVPAGPPVYAAQFGRLLGGHDRHSDELEDGMRRSLERIKTIVESG